MKKRTLSLFLATALTFGLIACGSSETTTTSTEATESTESASSESSESVDAESVSTGISFPLEESVTITITGRKFDSYVDFEETEFFQQIEEDTNVHIEWTSLSTSSFDESFGLMMAADNMPDALYGIYLMSGSKLVEYADQGYFMQLNQYMDAGLMPNLSYIYESRPAMAASNTAPDGYYYHIPMVNEWYNDIESNVAMMINTEWLDAIDMDMPSTTDELYEVLKAFDEAGDLNGNGMDDEIPMSFVYDSVIQGWGGVTGWFGTATAAGQPVIIDGELVMAEATEDYKDAMIYLNKLYSEGLLDQEIFTLDTTSYQARNNVAPYSVGVIADWNEEVIDGAEGTTYEYLPVLTSDNGSTPTWLTTDTNYTAIGFVMSSKTEHGEVIAAWIDNILSKENQLASFFGYPEFLEEIEDGAYMEAVKEDGSAYSKSERSWYSPANGGLYIMLMPEYYTYYEETSYNQNKFESFDYYGAYTYPDGAYNNSWLATTEESSELAILTTDIDSYLDIMAASFVSQGNIEEQWDSYLAQLETLGLSRMLEIKQGIYDRNKVE
ncbi:MAG: extracellular solute-binding protein [Lachnospiraceae bacterium]